MPGRLRETSGVPGAAPQAGDLCDDVIEVVSAIFNGRDEGRFFFSTGSMARVGIDRKPYRIVEEVLMYAIVQSGGRQYQVEPGAVVRLGNLPGQVGETVTLDQVLLVADGEQVQVGRPFVPDTAVRARIVEQGRHRKIVIFKHKRRKDYRKKQGHRQYFTAVLVEGIEGRGESSTAPVGAVERSEGSLSEA